MEMIKSLCMTMVYCPGLTCIQEGWQYHRLVDFQLGVKLDSISHLQTFARSLPNATLAFAILAVTHHQYAVLPR